MSEFKYFYVSTVLPEVKRFGFPFAQKDGPFYRAYKYPPFNEGPPFNPRCNGLRRAQIIDYNERLISRDNFIKYLSMAASGINFDSITTEAGYGEEREWG